MNVPRITDYSGQGVIPQLVKTVNALCDEVRANQIYGDNKTIFVNKSINGTTIRANAQGTSSRAGTTTTVDDPFKANNLYSYIDTSNENLIVNDGNVYIGDTYLSFDDLTIPLSSVAYNNTLQICIHLYVSGGKIVGEMGDKSTMDINLNSGTEYVQNLCRLYKSNNNIEFKREYIGGNIFIYNRWGE